MMSKILITYASHFGSTEEVASVIAETLHEDGYDVDCRLMADINSFDDYEAVLAGSAVNNGSWIPEAQNFVHEHKEMGQDSCLDEEPAFYAFSLTAVS
jgi:menaquinone-dependent protoporphyrinogen IX oxidase